MDLALVKDDVMLTALKNEVISLQKIGYKRGNASAYMIQPA